VLVEQGYSVQEGEKVAVGQAIGHLEGFKAVSDLYCVVEGVFAGSNPKLNVDPTLVDSDEYGEGWLYRVRGTPDPNSLDVTGYIQVLDATIDRMREQYE
jgi:glycine cleavage system H protein